LHPKKIHWEITKDQTQMLLDVFLSAKCMENTAIITALTKMLLDVFLYIMDVIKENAGCSADMIQNIGDIQPIAIGVDGL